MLIPITPKQMAKLLKPEIKQAKLFNGLIIGGVLTRSKTITILLGQNQRIDIFARETHIHIFHYEYKDTYQQAKATKHNYSLPLTTPTMKTDILKCIKQLTLT